MIDSFLPEGWTVGDAYDVRLPTYISVSKKTTKACNLNVYRNLHHHHLNNQKQNFHDEVKPLLRHIPRAEKIWIHYTIFAPRNGRLDTMNVGSIVDKYFSDTMVEAKKIMDDHFDHVVLISFSFGGVRPMDGHAIARIYILEPTEKDSDMRIILDQDDIQRALENYVETHGFENSTGVKIIINDDNIEAEVLMNPAANIPAKPKTTTTKNKGGRPKGSKNKPKPEVTDDHNDSEDGGNGTDSGSSESAAANSEAGTKATASTDETKKPEASSQKGNLFGDEDDQSSESSTSTENAGQAPETENSVKTTKKSSIFDAD